MYCFLCLRVAAYFLPVSPLLLFWQLAFIDPAELTDAKRDRRLQTRSGRLQNYRDPTKLRVHDVHTHPAEFTTRPRNNRFVQTYPASKISSWRGEPPSWPLRHIFFFTLYRFDDDVTVTVSSSFMNGAREFKSQQGCKLKRIWTFFRMLKQWFAKIM